MKMNALMDNARYDNDSNGCDIISDKSVHEDEQFSLCCLCGQTFTSIRSLHTHINVVHEEVADAFDFSSPKAENHETNPDPLDSHNPPCLDEEQCPKPESVFACPNCKKCYGGLESLRVHVESVHHGHRIPQCEICLKTFSTLSYLRMHIATVHEGVRAYACSFCEKSYTQKHSLKKHMGNAHPDLITQASLDDSVQSNSFQCRSGQSPYSSEFTYLNKSRKKLLVDSPITRDSSSPSPSGPNDADCSISFETKESSHEKPSFS